MPAFLLSPQKLQLPACCSPLVKHVAKRGAGALYVWRYDGEAYLDAFAQEYDYCDWALIPDNFRARLLIADLDSTLTPWETIDEIARRVGAGTEVAEITDAAMHGELDYAESFRARLRLLRGVPVADIQTWAAQAPLNDGVKQLFAWARAHGVQTAVVSGGLLPAVQSFCVRLGLGPDQCYGNDIEIIDGRLSGEISAAVLDATSKRAIMLDLCQRSSCEAQQAIAIGDGANDMLMLRACGLAVGMRPKPLLLDEVAVCLRHCGLHSLPLLLDASAEMAC